MKQLPIIIGGVHRSGTSLVRRVLNAHTNIYCGPEVKFLKEWYGDYVSVNDPIKRARFIESARSLLPDKELFAILGAALINIHKAAAQLAGKSRWADKNPENVLYLDNLKSLLGDEWLFVHVTRNPLDTLASIAEANFKYAIPSDLDDRIGFYKKYSEAGLRYSEKYPEKCYRVVYEKLVTSPEKEIGKLMRWLGEIPEITQTNFSFFEHQEGLEDPKIRKTKMIHTQSINRWQGVFTRREAKFILEKTGVLWNRLDSNNDYPLEKKLAVFGLPKFIKRKRS
ncbi:MAG: sulfotransferase [Chloroflexi bacterium]|nr:sulfotransferase [Chloroflexota bacterium]